MKRPVTPKRLQTDRPRITSRAAVKVRRPASNCAKTTRPSGTTR
ncbi:MAG: hypothetical protein QGI78_00600 [Phycisphaerales bacterium]|nr:hypothetical protein [Phycisphaerales bacterium]